MHSKKGCSTKKKEAESPHQEDDLLLSKASLKRVAEIYYNSDIIYPFNDDKQDISWVRMSEAELSSIPGLSCDWCESPAIVYNYVKFKHFILGKENGIDQYYLGIPDVFDPKRQNILEMERVECFKARDGHSARTGTNGYWIARL